MADALLNTSDPQQPNERGYSTFDEDSDDDVGPQPLVEAQDKANHKEYVHGCLTHWAGEG